MYLIIQQVICRIIIQFMGYFNSVPSYRLIIPSILLILLTIDDFGIVIHVCFNPVFIS